jgi:hypothetical protein
METRVLMVITNFFTAPAGLPDRGADGKERLLRGLDDQGWLVPKALCMLGICEASSAPHRIKVIDQRPHCC